MSRVERVTVRLGKTIPGPEYGGGQFANVKPEIEISILVGPEDNTDAIVKGASNYCVAKLEELKQMLIAEQTAIKPTSSQHTQSAPAFVPPPPTGAMAAQTKPGIQPAVQAQAVQAPPKATIPAVDPVTW